MTPCPIRRKLVFISMILLASLPVFAQEDSSKRRSYDSLSLKDLLNVKIVSASKTAELLFDAPLSGSVITKDEIRKAGSTSIMEALRLIPGVIVREQSNGNYDIHLRGMDNVPPESPFEITSNTTTLLMIDNRPTYSYLRGGTFWETLPIAINDVERIEVVRGPAAALYGPNAVSGVINIITRQYKKAGLHGVLNSQQGSYQTHLTNASLAYSTKRLSVIASGNYHHRNRAQSSYYEYSRDQYFENPSYMIGFLGDTIRNINERYPDQDLAMERYAGNIFVGYEAASRITLSLSSGLQHSKVQKILNETKFTPFSTNQSDSRYVDFKAGIRNFSAQLSYNSGTQVKDFSEGNKFDFQTFDANLEYNFSRKNFSIKPGVSYRSAIYDDTKYSDMVNKTGVFNSRGEITTGSAFIRGEYKAFDNKLRLVAGLTANKFNYPDTTYFSYQFSATYKVNKNHLFRVVLSKAPRSSNIYDSYVDQIIGYFPIGANKYTKVEVTGNKNLQLMTARMFELGYRGRLTNRLNIDIEAFAMQAENYSAFVQDVPYMYMNGADTVYASPIKSLNLPMELEQKGITLSLVYSSPTIQFKPFVTLQRTKIRNYAPFLTTPAADPVYNIYSGTGTEQSLESSPSVYGGFSLNYSAVKKWNFNINSYYYSKQTYKHVTNIIYNDGVRGIDKIKAKLIVNAKVSFNPVKGFHVFVSAKNLLNDPSREFFKADRIPFMLLGGINYEF